MKTIKLIIICIVFSNILYAQDWVNGLFPKPENTTYYYRSSTAYDADRDNAKYKALAQVLKESALRIGIIITLDEALEQLKNGTSQKVIIPINKVCEKITFNTYYGMYKADVLAQVAENANYMPKFTAFYDCNKGVKPTKITYDYNDETQNTILFSGVTSRYLSKTFDSNNFDAYGFQLDYLWQMPDVAVGVGGGSYFTTNTTNNNSDFGFLTNIYLGKRNAGISIGFGYGSNSDFGGHFDLPVSINLWVFRIQYKCSFFRHPTYDKNRDVGYDYDDAYGRFLAGDQPKNIASVTKISDWSSFGGGKDYTLLYKADFQHQVSIGIRIARW